MVRHVDFGFPSVDEREACGRRGVSPSQGGRHGRRHEEGVEEEGVEGKAKLLLPQSFCQQLILSTVEGDAHDVAFRPFIPFRASSERSAQDRKKGRLLHRRRPAGMLINAGPGPRSLYPDRRQSCVKQLPSRRFRLRSGRRRSSRARRCRPRGSCRGCRP